ncbi:MAG TPA: MmgE/PrpD family protein [Streptosporangiaceae bacterium]
MIQEKTDASLTEQLSAWASSLRLDDVPGRVVELAKSQILSQLAAIRAGLAHPLGQALVDAFGSPLQEDARTSACVLAGLGSWLNLDDTAYAGHLSNSTVSVPLAYAYAGGLDGGDLLTAVIAANECAARITASATLGPLRGQSAGHTSIAGAVSGRLKCSNAPAERWVNAFGLALAMPPWTLLRAFVGSDARVLSAFTPVRMGMDACDGAEAGLSGAPDIIEHKDGFLARFAAVPLPEAVVMGLGQRWHTETLSFKVRPGGPGADAAVDCAIQLHSELGGLTPDQVSEIVVAASAYTMFLGQTTRTLVAGPDASGSSLPLSVPYTVATALLNGDLTVADFSAPAVLAEERWALARKVRLVHDEDMTRRLFASVAPFGEAIRQAGDRALAWVREFGGLELPAGGSGSPHAETFEQATKHFGARVTVQLADGRSVTRQQDIPAGGAGPDTRARHAELMRAKFLAVGGCDEVADGCAKLERATPHELARLLETALARQATSKRVVSVKGGQTE